MFLASKIVRHLVLGMMFFLAMTAACSCDSYDPDPYDDTPPVVTVEFNYIVPSKVSLRRPGASARNKQHSSQAQREARMVAPLVVLLESFPAATSGMGNPQLIVPLRR
jgi:hypothetical protein